MSSDDMSSDDMSSHDMNSQDLGLPGPPPRSRGLIALREANCTVCMICVRECPDWCITIEGHAEHAAAPGSEPGAEGAPARLLRSTRVLDRLALDFCLG